MIVRPSGTFTARDPEDLRLDRVLITTDYYQQLVAGPDGGAYEVPAVHAENLTSLLNALKQLLAHPRVSAMLVNSLTGSIVSIPADDVCASGMDTSLCIFQQSTVDRIFTTMRFYRQ